MEPRRRRPSVRFFGLGTSAMHLTNPCLPPHACLSVCDPASGISGKAAMMNVGGSLEVSQDKFAAGFALVGAPPWLVLALAICAMVGGLVLAVVWMRQREGRRRPSSRKRTPPAARISPRAPATEADLCEAAPALAASSKDPLQPHPKPATPRQFRH